MLTFTTLARRAAAIAANLPKLIGAAPGEPVAIFATNVPEYVEALFACWWGGLAAAPINAKLHPNEALQIIANSGARAVITCQKLASTLGQIIPTDTPVIVMGSDTYEGLAEGPAATMVQCKPDSLAWLFYTSGTTGVPKGAMISHANLTALVAGYAADVDGIEPGDAIIHAAPMSHGSGLYILPFIAAGGVQVVPPSGGFDECELFELIAAHPRCSLFAAPTMVKRMTRFAKANAPDHHNLRTVVYGGGPLYYEDLLESSNYFGNRFAQIYGQGECPMSITSMRRGAFTAASARGDEGYLRSVGSPFSFGEIRITDANGNESARGDVGEICVRSPAVCLGYWRNPKATAEKIRENWLYTGDLGKVAINGTIVLAGRATEVIISGGTNIYPIEVETVLLSYPGVAEAAVIGIPDAEWGEAIVAYVVASGPTQGLAERLERHCIDNIARFKRPKQYRFVEDLPKNSYGKILKRELVERELAI